MTDPQEQQREADELDLEAETVEDLEVDVDISDDVHGGSLGTKCKTPT